MSFLLGEFGWFVGVGVGSWGWCWDEFCLLFGGC